MFLPSVKISRFNAIRNTIPSWLKPVNCLFILQVTSVSCAYDEESDVFDVSPMIKRLVNAAQKGNEKANLQELFASGSIRFNEKVQLSAAVAKAVLKVIQGTLLEDFSNGTSGINAAAGDGLRSRELLQLREKIDTWLHDQPPAPVQPGAQKRLGDAHPHRYG